MPLNSKKSLWLLLALIALALAVRVIFIFQWQDTPYGGLPYLDARVYDDWAQNIMAGHWLSERAFYQSPLFPYVLALLYAIAGHTVLTVALFNAVLGAASCGLLAYAAGRAFGERALLLTGILAALYAPSIFFTPPVLKEALGFFLLTLFLVFSLFALDTNRRRYFVGAGISLGLAILTRGNALFLLAALPLLAFRQHHEKPLQRSALHMLAALLTLAPATLHNAVVSHDFVPVTYSNGFNFYIGNREGSNGANAYPADIPTNDKEERGTTIIAQNAYNHDLKPSEVSAYWFGKGVDFVTLHPLEAAVLWLRKAALFFSDMEFSDNYHIEFFRAQMNTFLSWPVFPGFGLVLALGIFAWLASDKERRRAMFPFVVMAGIYMASVLPFYVTDRYRLPVVVFLLPLAGAAALPAFARTKQLVVAALIAALVYSGSVIYPPKNYMYTVAGWLSLGNIQLQHGKDSEGVEYISRAIAMAPQRVEAYWYVRAASAADRANQHEKAMQLIEAAIRTYPDEKEQILLHYAPRK